MQIEHVVVLCLENRSFDHMLGFLEHPNSNFDGLLRDGPHDNPGWDGAPRVPATPNAKNVLPFGPDHSHDAVMEQLAITGTGSERRATNEGFIASYERKGRGLAPPAFGGLLAPLLGGIFNRRAAAPPVLQRGPLIMLCQAPERVPVLSRLALEFAVCDHWFCSVPGETWPNRNYLHAATSDGETDIELRPYRDRTIFELLEDNGSTWRIYHDDTPQVWAFPALWDTADRHENWFPTAKFAVHVAKGDLPAYSFIEPNHRPPFHTLDHEPLIGAGPNVSTSQHPENNLVSSSAYDSYDDTHADTDFDRGETLIANVYEALRANPELFQRTVLLITYDEHGGLYDHVPPPMNVPGPGGGREQIGRLLHGLWHRKAQAFDFTMLGPRVPTVIVSPLIPAGTLVRETHDHASVPATLRAVFAPSARPLTRRDAWSPPFHHALSLEEPRLDLPDLSSYTGRLPAAVAAGTAAVPIDAEVPAKEGGEAAQIVPEYYESFIKQADQVRAHLLSVGEPEIRSVNAPPGPQRAAQISDAFTVAAHRHRHPTDPAAAAPAPARTGTS